MLPYSQDDIDTITRIEGDSAFLYQQRRHLEWTENYTLYRDRIFINRLTQRQTVNIPLMKYIIQTSLSSVDDPTELYFRSKDNDSQKEVFINGYYHYVWEDQSGDLKDLADKKQVFQYGRSTKSWNIENGKMIMELHDTLDIFFSEFTDPTDIDGTCRYLEHRHIFKPLSTLELNPDYDTAAIGRLKEFYATTAGVINSDFNKQSLIEKNQRMQDMGAVRINSPEVGETYVELRKCFIRLFDKELNDDCIYYVVKCENEILLYKRQEEVIGKTIDNYWRSHFVYESWAEDLERTDIYPDGVADYVRPMNKVVNAWFSAEVENRTLRSFGMNYFNSSLENFDPQTFEAAVWGWYPIPVPNGKGIDDVVKNIPIPDLSSNYNAMSFVIGLAEKTSAANPILSGAYGGSPHMTLGELQLILQQSKTRMQALIKYSSPSWKKFGDKFCKMIEAAGDKLDAVTLYQKGSNDRVYSKEVSPDMWETKSGWLVEVTTVQEEQAEALQTVQTLQAVSQLMPGNIPLMKTMRETALRIVPGLSSTQVREILDFQDKQDEAMAASGGQPNPMLPPGSPQPPYQPTAPVAPTQPSQKPPSRLQPPASLASMIMPQQGAQA